MANHDRGVLHTQRIVFVGRSRYGVHELVVDVQVDGMWCSIDEVGDPKCTRGGKIHWNWIESYDAKVTDAFREILLKILKGGKNDRR